MAAQPWSVGELIEQALDVPHYPIEGRRYATALRLYRPLAEQGNADAQQALGLIYAKGDGVTQDNAEAVKWFRKAAEQGNGSAQSREWQRPVQSRLHVR